MTPNHTTTSHIVIIPTPGIGHLIPLVKLAKRILNDHHFTICFLIPTNGPPTQAQKTMLAELPKEKAEFYFLPPVNLNDLPANTNMVTNMALTLARSLPAIRDHLKEIQSTCRGHLTAIVVDLYGTDAFDVAWEFNMKPYIFFSTNATCLSFFLNLPELDTKISTEFREMDGPLQLPGCVPLHGKDLLDSVQDRTNDAYKWLLHIAKKYKLAEGIMVNSFVELEGKILKELQNLKSDFPKVYPVGPLIQIGSSDRVDNTGCLTWLDDQPDGSVLFVSFGSGGTLSYDQLIELANGLEMSEQRFLWVMKPPNNEIANACYFTIEGQRDPLHFLPKGFLDRVKGRGMVVPNWAPQIDILNHGSTGGFLTHCGWNSVLESVVHGVPLIVWPLYAEQCMNAVILNEGLKIALRPRPKKNGLVYQLEIAMIVKGLIEGEEGKEIRNRMKELKDSAAKVLTAEGSSTKGLSELILKWKPQE